MRLHRVLLHDDNEHARFIMKSYYDRINILMMRWGLRQRSSREVAGQLFRVVGAATKTAFGLVPAGNTGGANVSPFRALPIPADLQILVRAAQSLRSRFASHRVQGPLDGLAWYLREVAMARHPNQDKYPRLVNRQ